MKIKISDLRDFFSRSKKIKSNGILPIHEYLLFEVEEDYVSISKSNGNSFCKHTVEQANDETGKFLVEEKRLSALVANAKGDFIHIKAKGKKVTLKDSVNEIKLEGSEAVDAFQKFPLKDGEGSLLNMNVLLSLFEARNFVAIIESNFAFVYTHKKDGKFFVFASNGHILYLREFSEELPELALSADICSTIAAFDNIEHYTAGNYDIFDTGRTIYGFVQTTYKAPEYLQIIRSINTEETLQIKKADVLSFCELVGSLAVKSLPIIKFADTDAEDKLFVRYNEGEVNCDAERELDVVKNFYPEPFALNAAFLKDVLKCFGSEDVLFSPGPQQKMFGVWNPEDKGLTVLIMPLAFN